MSRSIARLIACSLVIALGLTTMPQAAVAQASSQPDLLHAYVSKLPVGSLVKVTPKEGRSFKGILMVVEGDAIVVKPKTRIARPERQIKLADIDFVELQERNGGSNGTIKAVGIGVASAVGVFMGLILVSLAIAD
jgi:hypothetical protein